VDTPKLSSVCECKSMLASDGDAIEALHAKVFGPGRFARTAFRLRERAAVLLPISRKALSDNGLVGAVTMSRIHIGPTPGVLLGPLAVEPMLRDRGIGRQLLTDAVGAAFQAGELYVLLVGDLPYYAPVGFSPVPPRSMVMPGPVDPKRLLIAVNPIGNGALPTGPVSGSRAQP
jgi:predicted N-acetyltransferase YhbS